MSHSLRKLLGKQLIKLSTGRKEFTEELPTQGLILALYFIPKGDGKTNGESENYTSRLTDLHKELMRNRKGSFEVIQISLEEQSETTLTPNNSSIATSPPFYALYGENSRRIQDYLIRKFEVGGNSVSLILIDGSTGRVINFQVKEKISVDPKGVHFPWPYPKCSQLLASTQLITSVVTTASQKNQAVNADLFEGTVKGLYFAAYWCPPCRSFVALLEEVYKKINGEKKKFEIVFVSSDRSQESFDKLFSLQPCWPAVPFEAVQIRKDLTAMYNIQGIPAVVIVDRDDTLITLDGRTEITDDVDAIDFPWHAKPVEELRDKHSIILNNFLCLIYFIGNQEGEYEKVESLLQPIAIDIQQSDLEEALEPKFFIATDCELSESLRVFMDLDESIGHLIIMHDFRYVVGTEDQIKDEKNIREFLRKFQLSNADLKYRYISSKFI